MPKLKAFEFTYSCKFSLVASVVEATDAVLGIYVIMIFDESETRHDLVIKHVHSGRIGVCCYPLQCWVPASMIDLQLMTGPNLFP